MRRLLVLALLIVPSGALSYAEIIDRVLAAVAGHIITQSDVLGALTCGLVEVPQGGDVVERALDRLIDRELVLAEVERYLPPEPAPGEVHLRLERIRARFPSGAAYQAALAASGFTESRLADWVRNDLRIDRYLEQRFALTVATEEEIAEYYRAHAAELSADSRVRPLDEVREQIRERLSSERRRALVADWIDGLRRRADISRLYLPGGSGGTER
jgi:hypothetical protein